jgi:hypothetical protein
MHIITMTKQHTNASDSPAPQGDGAPDYFTDLPIPPKSEFVRCDGVLKRVILDWRDEYGPDLIVGP